ncbi:hypothetical protein [Chengkuizengella axinellae]|uniref:Phage protein n=1 Tax=Chengkuizengella axinellae TaxID=3064388 RepID=A0ABT9J696_9BACL|nr:hypothetical protein [Chengkuizengella sp. 2205SS18-9]MDP5277148.1 hypothetical protein [Chengkuizengella sp. 2205SS18-9]
MPIKSDWAIRHNGKAYDAGIIIHDIPKKDEQRLVDNKVAHFVSAEPVENDTAPEMIVDEIKEFLKTVEYIEDVEELLKKEKAKKEPRKTALDMLEKWLKEAEEDESKGDDPGGQ